MNSFVSFCPTKFEQGENPVPELLRLFICSAAFQQSGVYRKPSPGFFDLWFEKTGHYYIHIIGTKWTRPKMLDPQTIATCSILL